MIKRVMSLLIAILLILISVAHADDSVQLTSVVTFGLDSYVLPGFDSQGKVITTIGENAFSGQDKLRVVALPSTIQTIKDRAFIECTGLNAILIPETVVNFGEDLFQDEGERVAIIAPAESAAIRYAQQHAIRYVELEQHTLSDANSRYIALLLFKFADNSTYFSRYNDTDTYLLTLNSADTLNMALVNRLELAWNAIVDALRADGKNSYMTEQYMLQLGSILEDMQGIQSITVDTGLFQELTSLAAKGADSYEKLVTWLLGSEFRDDPFVKSVIKNGDKLESLSKALGGFDKVMNILLYACRDYSKSITVLDSLLAVSENYSNRDFHDAVLSLKQLFEGNVTGMLSSLLSEFHVDIGEAVTDGILESISSGALLLYNTANFGIDFALSVEGIKEEADAQTEYIALLDISYECEKAFRAIMLGKDVSHETMTRLDVITQFCRALRLRLYDLQIDLFQKAGNTTESEDLSWSRAYYFQQADIVSNYAVDFIPRHSSISDKLVTEPSEHPHNTILSTDSLSAYWLAQPGKYIYDMTEYGYSNVENKSQTSLDGVALGELGQWYLPYGAATTAKEMVNQIIEEDLFDCVPLVNFWNNSHLISDIHLSKSELRKQEKQFNGDDEYWEEYWEDDEFYVSEIWAEFYLFNGAITDKGLTCPFELLIKLESSSEGENSHDGIVLIYPN